MNHQEIVYDGWQKQILAYDGNVLLCTGRQVGKTTTLAAKAAIYLVKHPNSKIVIVSLTEDQAKLIIVMIIDYLEKHHSTLISCGKDKPTQNKIVLKNKATALARPVGTTGDAVRGFTGDVLIIDEASRMPELAFTAAKPVLLTTAGQIWQCSTPAGKQGYFYNSFQNKNKRFKIWHISSEEVIKKRQVNGNWTQQKKEQALDFLESERMDMSELQYGQEYLGLFLDDLRRFFDDELIAKTCVLKRPKSIIRKNNYMGVDIARLGNDESSFEIVNATNREQIKQTENIVTKKQLTTQTEDKIKDLTQIWNNDKIGIDAGSGSLGVGIYDHLLKDPITKRKIIAMNNRSISLDREGKNKQRIFKEDLYDNLKAMLEHGELFLLDDENLQRSLRSIQFEFLKDKGQLTKVRIFGNYSHIVEGLIRVAWIAKMERVKKMFIDYI